jgi:hypothetical protein
MYHYAQWESTGFQEVHPCSPPPMEFRRGTDTPSALILGRTFIAFSSSALQDGGEETPTFIGASSRMFRMALDT